MNPNGLHHPPLHIKPIRPRLQHLAALRQGHAQIRYFRKLGIPVEPKPNGRPLVRRSDWERFSLSKPVVAKGPKWSVPA